MVEMVFSRMQHAALETWQKALEAQLARAEAMAQRAAEAEQRGGAHALIAIDEWARLTKETLAYQAELGRQAREQMLDAARRMSVMVPFAPPAAPRVTEAMVEAKSA